MRTVQLPETKEPVTAGVTIAEWLVEEGAAVAQNDLLARGETETALVELRAAKGGILRRILVPAGTSADWDAPLAEIEEQGEGRKAKGEEGQGEGRKAKGETMEMTTTSSAVPGSAPAGAASGPKGEVQPILMPQAGQSMEEGTIVAWRVAPGDTIKVGQVIFEVETDKATIEVEADQAGRLARIVVAQDETVPVKTPVAYLAENDADVDAYLTAQGATEAGQQPQTEVQATSVAAAPTPSGSASPSVSKSVPTPTTGEGRVKASPAARKAAAERGLDIAAIGAGSGPGGRIVSTDVAAAPAAAAAAASAAPTRKRMSGMRRAIARNLTTSKQTIPHFYMKATFDAAPMLAYYAAQKERFKCSLNDVIVMASAAAIREFPGFRTRLEGEELIEYPTANVGIAVGMDDGLVVPVAIGADRLSFEQLAAETRRLVEAARSGKIEGMGQGVFTITNLGMFGVEEFSAIINPPEAAILAVSGIREAVVVRDGAMRAGKVMTVTLSCDHRVIDGLLAAKFLARFQEIVAGLGKGE